MFVNKNPTKNPGQGGYFWYRIQFLFLGHEPSVKRGCTHTQSGSSLRSGRGRKKDPQSTETLLPQALGMVVVSVTVRRPTL